MQLLRAAAAYPKGRTACGIALCIGIVSSTPVLANENQLALGQVINAICSGSLNSTIATECNRYTALADSRQYVTQVTPDETAAFHSSLLLSSDMQTKMLTRHLNGLRYGSALERWQQQSPELTPIQDQSAATDAANPASPINLFLDASNVEGDHKATDFEPAYDNKTDYYSVGGDYRINKEWLTGIAYGNGESEIEFINQGQPDNELINSETDHVSLYASWYRRDFAVDMSLQYNDTEFTSLRRLPDAAALANFDSQLLGLHLSGAFDFSQNQLIYGPLAAIDLLSGHIDAYTEQGSSIWNAQIDRQDIDSAILSMGAQATYSKTFTWGAIVPYFKGVCRYQIENDRNQISGQLVIDPNTGFTIQADKPDTTWFEFSAGVSAMWNHKVSLHLNYEAIVDDRATSQESISAGLNIAL